jgi:hypothetical protein
MHFLAIAWALSMATKSKSVQYTPDEIVMPKQYKKYQKDRGVPIINSKVWSGLFGDKSEE